MNIARYFSRLLFGLLLLSTQFAQAIPIDYELVDLGNNRYQYNYTINNETTLGLDGFSIFFDPALYTNLLIENASANWDTLIYEPDSSFGLEGALESIAIGTPLAPGDNLPGFSVSFDWLGGNVFGGQNFEFFDSVTFDSVLIGSTAILNNSGTVPVPTTLALLFLGWGALHRSRQRN